VVAHVLADRVVGVDDGDTEGVEVAGGPDARPEQDRRAAVRAAREDDRVGLDRLAVRQQYGARPVAVELDAVDHHAGADPQVLPGASLLSQIGERRALPHAVDLVDRERTNAERVRAVEVADVVVPGRLACLDVGLRQRRLLLVEEAPDSHRPALTVPAPGCEIVLELAVVGKDRVPAPLVGAHRLPAPEVDGGRPQRVGAEHPGAADLMGQVLDLGVVRTRLEQRDRSVRVLGQPRGQGAAGGSGSADDDVTWHRWFSPLSVLG